MSPFVQKITEHKAALDEATARVKTLQDGIDHHKRSIDVLSADLNDAEKAELAALEKTASK